MTTITINEKTKAGKTFLEFAKNLPFVKLEQSEGLSKPAIAEVKETKAQLIAKLSKKVNRNMTKKLLAMHNIKL